MGVVVRFCGLEVRIFFFAKEAHTGTRTRNLLLRRQAPYPLGHTGFHKQTKQKRKPDAGLEPATSRLRACHSTD